MNRCFPAFSLVPLSLAVLLAYAPALRAETSTTAMPADSATTAVLDTVTVTASGDAEQPTEATGAYTAGKSRSATGLSLSQRETPQSVSVATRAKMDDFGLSTASDVLRNVTGVTVEQVETDRAYYTARGFGITNFQIDGVTLPYNSVLAYGDMDTAIYDRVDVVRGASGLLSPSGNPSATINFISKRPTREFQFSGAATVGSWNDKRLDLDVSGPLTKDGNVRGRAVMAQEKSDSYLDRYAHQKTTLYGIVEADVADATTVALSYTRQHSHSNSPLWGALPLNYSDGSQTNYDVSTNTAADWAYMDTVEQRIRAEAEHRFNDRWKASLVYTYRQLRNNSELFYLYGTPSATTGLGLYSYPARNQSTLRQDTLNFALDGKFDFAGRTHEIAVGSMITRSRVQQAVAYGEGIGTELSESLDDWNGSYTKPAFDSSYANSMYVDRQLSVYAALHYHLSDKLKAITGISVTRAVSSGVDYGVAHDSSDTGSNPYLGLVYDFNRNWTAYGSVTRIFNPQSEMTDKSGATLSPATGWNQEAGVKSSWLENKLQANAAVFRTRQDNLAEAGGTDSGRTYYNATNVHARGFEAELSGELSKGWQATLGYTTLSIEDASGQAARTYIPRQMIRLSTSYRLPFYQAVTIGSSIQHQSRTWISTGTSSSASQSAYSIYNLMASYDLNRNIKLTARVNNVSNVKYYNSLYNSQAYYGAPRNFSLSVGWKF
jgi:outer membrane receptor for ferric coprogen and ferric-rhodotorulic acid